MKFFIPFALFLYLNCGHLANAQSILEEDEGLGFILNNFTILLEKNDPNKFPTKLRLIQLPDQTDSCSSLVVLKDIPSGFKEDNCPRKRLYLTLSNWDSAPDQITYLIGNEYSWKVASLVIDHRQSQSDWAASIKLAVAKIANGTVTTEFRTLNIISQNDVYTVRFKQH